MWKNFVKDYLSFTKKDRVGILVLLTLIFIVVLLPYIWPVKKGQPATKQQLDSLRMQTAQLEKSNLALAPTPEAKEHDSRRNLYPPRESVYNKKGSLFYFDPNTLDPAGWQRLGVREKTVGTIMKYRAKGGQFRRPEDLGKIYGLFDYERLLPYVKIVEPPSLGRKYEDRISYPAADKPAYMVKHFATIKPIDINSADTAAFIALPGIGSKLAARIVNFRDKLGGFYSIQQVGETYGVPDSTYNKIAPSLQCNNPAVKQLNINTADANTLKQHPYIRWNLANAIVQYRMQHGNFASVDDLQQIALITPEIFKKLRPYLNVQ